MKEEAQKIIRNIENNHNHSLFEEIFDRRKHEMDKTALFYRGTKITYGDLKNNVEKYARALKLSGITKESILPVCMNNCPEFVYLLGAISIIGGKIKSIGSDFEHDFTIKKLNSCNSSIIFVTDDKYDKIKNSIECSNISNKVVISLTESLPEHDNPYIALDKEWYDFQNRVNEIKRNDVEIQTLTDFLKDESKYTGKIYGDVDLMDPFTITYSSGSTNSSKPKEITHSIKSYITMGIYHDSKISKVPSMHGLRLLSHIPTHSNTSIMSGITDSLMQGSEIALEPIYDQNHFLNSLIINKPSFPCATRSFWVNAAKQYYNDPRYKNLKLPFLIAPMIVGEPNSPGEEKFCNKFLRSVSAGKEKTHLPISPVTISMAGGDCEHGGLFFALYKSLQSKNPKYSLCNIQNGLRTYSMVDFEILNNEGKYCKPGEIGRLVADSPCTMLRYEDDEEATKNFFLIDAYGRKWPDCSVYGYKNKYNELFIKGRFNKNDNIPLFQIADEVLKDTKNILSCEVIMINDIYVIHFETMPNKCVNICSIIKSIEKRCMNRFPSDVVSKFVYRYRNNVESFPLTGCGKRNTNVLKTEGFNNCIRIHNGAVLQFNSNNEVLLDSQQKENVSQKMKKL